LRTVRGSATSGHVTGNKSYVRPNQIRKVIANHTGTMNSEDFKNNDDFKKKASQEILLHNKKREVNIFMYILYNLCTRCLLLSFFLFN
jgi:hypothetical protein